MTLSQLYLSTIDPQAQYTAKIYGLGLEIAEYCTAWNMDEHFPETDAAVREKICHCPRRLLHAPFNELFPCAIDPQAQALAAQRYRQAIALAKTYGAEKIVIHGGFHPQIYYPQWYVEHSVRFWKEFFRQDPGVEIVLENVLESQPRWLLDIVSAVAHPRLKLCLDVGHANAYSPVPVAGWLEDCAPYLSHFHVHNNDGSADTHSALFTGSIAMKEFFAQAQALCPDATFTLELPDAEPSVRRLLEELPWN